jgi:alpha-galactosidase
MVRTWLATFLLVALCAVPSKGTGDTYSDYQKQDETWIIGNSAIEAAFQITSDGRFRYRWIRDAATGHEWRVPDDKPSSPIAMTVDGIDLDGNTSYALQSYSFIQIDNPAAGVRLSIDVKPASASGDVQFEADVYSGQPFLRYRTIYRNLSASPSLVTQADMLAWKFQDAGEEYRDFFVNQWNSPQGVNFEPHESNLSASIGPVEMQTGANALHAAWRALRDGQDNGLVAAWEFDGRASADTQDQPGTGVLELSATIDDLNHRISPYDQFQVPDAFLGVYHGDWDEAGYRTQRFADNVLAVPLPDPDKFPYAMFDTWGYGENIDETTAMNAAQLAAAEGAEVFILDFGWARAIGDWYPDPVKFPHGIKPISDYVHPLGMKFGLHIPFLEAAPNSPVILAHPDWQAVDPDQTYNYFGAGSLCPSHKPARDWIISELNRIIHEYGVDWVTQDGYNMVKICNSAFHTHTPGDSNYANAIDGLDTILQTVQQSNPSVLWENCEDGGSMQTFHMVQRYVTSIANDSADALTTRHGVWGATSPFPPRYTDRYMQDDPIDTYHSRSYMFGGPMILMNQITNWSPDMLVFAAQEMTLYKAIRTTIRDSKIYHLTQQPDGTFNDVIESYNEQQNQAFIFVYDATATNAVQFVQPQGLNPASIYSVAVSGADQFYVSSGQNLMDTGFWVPLKPGTAEVIGIAPR